MRILCDSNVFLAATLESHPHHRTGRAWLTALPTGNLACFCRATQQSFLRLLTVVEWMKEDVCTNEEAIVLYGRLRADPRIGFLEDASADFEKAWFGLATDAHPAPKRWMAAYLAALAIHHRVPFASFDKGMQRYRQDGLQLILLG